LFLTIITGAVISGSALHYGFAFQPGSWAATSAI